MITDPKDKFSHFLNLMQDQLDASVFTLEGFGFIIFIASITLGFHLLVILFIIRIWKND